jgi:signal peptidase I
MAKKHQEGNDSAQPRASKARTRPTAKAKPAPDGNAAWEWAKSGLIAFVLFLVMRTFLLQTFVITSGSMENTLLVGDYLIVNRAAIGSRIPFTGLRIPGYSTPRRGDVLVFDPPHEQDLKLVKRLIGMPGDTVSMQDKRLYLNGEPQEEPYVRHVDQGDERHPWMEWQYDFLHPSIDRAAYEPTRDNWGPIVIPDDRYFMLGDNRDTSLDSRYWGLLEGWRLEGRAARIYYSYDKQSLKPFRFFRDVRADRIGDPIR